jgi:hypothetical protein
MLYHGRNQMETSISPYFRFFYGPQEDWNDIMHFWTSGSKRDLLMIKSHFMSDVQNRISTEPLINTYRQYNSNLGT